MPRKLDNVSRMVRGQVGMSMNRLNLFNLYRKQPINYLGKTLYQQKWAAKSETRSYHGEHLKEKRFKKVLFEPELKTFSQLDASLKGGQDIAPTPITLQTYATLEKRLEFALFRSMFASSVRQARQFILGGYVKVNGVTIKHPSFPLKSGDVFSVDPERVLYALGKSKPSLTKSIGIDNKQIRYWNHYVNMAKKNPQKVWEMQQNKPESLNSIANLEIKEKNQNKEQDSESIMKTQQKRISRNSILKDIIELGNTSSEVTETTFEAYGNKIAQGKCIQIYETLKNNNSSIIKNLTDAELDNYFSKEIEKSADEKIEFRKINNILRELEKSEWERIRLNFENSSAGTNFYDSSYAEKLTSAKSLNKEEILEDESKANVNLPWQKHLHGRKDPSKSYFTPWTPRPFLGAFAILPSHIEISFDTCHAVYLRDPIARPGHSEVLSPFAENVHERAYILFRKARNLSQYLPPLLKANRSIEKAQLELKWIKEELPKEDWAEAINQRSKLVPLQYILKTQPFGELNILCRKGVLIPRWETAEWTNKLTDLLIDYGLNNLRVIDACTGSGCIPLLMYHKFLQHGSNINITGFDISPKAIKLSEENMEKYMKSLTSSQIENFNLNYEIADLFDPRLGVELHESKENPVDLITSNPPYVLAKDYNKSVLRFGVEKSVKLHEPSLALLGDNEFYDQLINNMVLPSRALGFVFEVGYASQVQFVREILDNEEWGLGLRKDSADSIRCVIGWKRDRKLNTLKSLCDEEINE
ncbi:hypothetical protein KGF54_002085 [Candida jiufengensis]|uniref:uncharacterized protein n=1 Tax=Candida jiufengensis TaxID=497108 RepID=UPI00222585E1|nr:uncharacterized protein KGF54_002085 [Candida jiufengensis]KAI5954310.1 hypothetical protein KGF54_002085 [Candida jiufengensis]